MFFHDLIYLFLDKNLLSSSFSMFELYDCLKKDKSDNTISKISFEVFTELFMEVFYKNPLTYKLSLEACLEDLLREKKSGNNVFNTKVFPWDDQLKTLLSVNMLSYFSSHRGNFEKLVESFLAENYTRGKVFLTYSELKSHHRGITFGALFHAFSLNEVIPQKVSFDLFFDCIAKTVQVNSESSVQLYNVKGFKETIGEWLEGDKKNSVRLEGDFEIDINETVIFFGRIAYEVSKVGGTNQENILEKIKDFVSDFFGSEQNKESFCYKISQLMSQEKRRREEDQIKEINKEEQRTKEPSIASNSSYSASIAIFSKYFSSSQKTKYLKPERKEEDGVFGNNQMTKVIGEGVPIPKDTRNKQTKKGKEIKIDKLPQPIALSSIAQEKSRTEDLKSFYGKLKSRIISQKLRDRTFDNQKPSLEPILPIISLSKEFRTKTIDSLFNSFLISLSEQRFDLSKEILFQLSPQLSSYRNQVTQLLIYHLWGLLYCFTEKFDQAAELFVMELEISVKVGMERYFKALPFNGMFIVAFNKKDFLSAVLCLLKVSELFYEEEEELDEESIGFFNNLACTLWNLNHLEASYNYLLLAKTLSDQLITSEDPIALTVIANLTKISETGVRLVSKQDRSWLSYHRNIFSPEELLLAKQKLKKAK